MWKQSKEFYMRRLLAVIPIILAMSSIWFTNSVVVIICAAVVFAFINGAIEHFKPEADDSQTGQLDSNIVRKMEGLSIKIAFAVCALGCVVTYFLVVRITNYMDLFWVSLSAYFSTDFFILGTKNLLKFRSQHPIF